MTDEDGTILERYRYRVYGEHEILTSNFDTKNNNCYVSCDNTYQSCFDACNGDPTCEAGCLATKNTCDSNCAATDYAGNVHNFLWGGSLYEPETNLYWMRNRYYHKDMHRFINQDPIGIWGDANNLGNGFAYVAGMVIEASDPTGLASDANSAAAVNGFDKNSVTLEMSRAEALVMSWAGSAILNIGGGFWAGGPIGAFSGAVSVAGEIAVDLGGNPDLNFALNLGVWKFGFYALAWQKAPIEGAKVAFNVAKDTGFVANEFLKAYDRMNSSQPSQPTTNSINGDFGGTGGDSGGSVNPDTGSNTGGDAGGDSEDPGTGTPPIYEDDTGGAPIEYSAGSWTYDNGDGTSTEVYDDDTVIIYDNKTGETIYCEGDGCEILTGQSSSYPSDPDNVMDRAQKLFMHNLLMKMLKRGDSSQPPVFKDNSTGPNGAIMFFRNPYYVNKDPMKTLIIEGHSGRGFMFVRNPFAPPADYNPYNSTADFWFHSGFNRGEIGPGWE